MRGERACRLSSHCPGEVAGSGPKPCRLSLLRGSLSVLRSSPCAQERVPQLMPSPERLIIVTGWGRSRSAVQDSDLRGRVESVLADLGVPTLPTDNPGQFIVDAEVCSRGM